MFAGEANVSKSLHIHSLPGVSCDYIYGGKAMDLLTPAGMALSSSKVCQTFWMVIVSPDWVSTVQCIVWFEHPHALPVCAALHEVGHPVRATTGAGFIGDLSTGVFVNGVSSFLSFQTILCDATGRSISWLREGWQPPCHPALWHVGMIDVFRVLLPTGSVNTVTKRNLKIIGPWLELRAIILCWLLVALGHTFLLEQPGGSAFKNFPHWRYFCKYIAVDSWLGKRHPYHTEQEWHFVMTNVRG